MKLDAAHSDFQPLPTSLEEASEIAENSEFVRRTLPDEIRRSIFRELDRQIKDYSDAADKDDFEHNAYFKYI